MRRQHGLRDIEPDNRGLHQNRCLSGRMTQVRLAAWGNNVYYVGTNNGSTYSFGTVNSAGQTTTIGTGLSFGGGEAEKLMFAPNGTLYGFDVDDGGGSGAWGSINLATGAFTKIGNLNTYFPSSALDLQ